MTEQEFHKARRMFIVIDGTVLVAPAGDGRTHYEWVASLIQQPHTSEIIGRSTRGYVINGRLVAYIGQDFDRWVDRKAVVAAYDVFDRLCGPITHIGLGAIPGKNHPWEPKVLTPADVAIPEFRKEK